MTTPDVPAGRGRDELREKLRHLTRDSGPLGSAVCALLKAAEAELPVMVMPDESRAIVDLLVPQETPAEGISLSAQLSQAAAWMRVWDECQRLGMDTYGAPSTRTGLDIVLDFIRGRAAPQEAREGERCQAVHFTRSMQCKLPARHGGEHIAGSGEGETRWTTEVADRLDASLAAARPAPETDPEPFGWVVEMQISDVLWETRRNARDGSYLWSRDEAEKERRALDMDGLPVRIAPVYLGAPVPAETTERSES